jgi:hypothetical protein
VVADGDNTVNLAVTSFTAGNILDVAGNPMTATTLPVTNLPTGRRVDTVAPSVSSFGTTAPAGAYKTGSVITITATMSETVQALGTIVATLNTGATVTLTAAAQGTLLSGIYTVADGQNVANLAVTQFTAGAVLDLAGNAMIATTLPVTNLPTRRAVDTVAPFVTRFGTTAPVGTYKAGTAITITARVSETVQAGTSFEATLDTGATVTLSTATRGTALSGTYTVADGENTANLTVVSFTPGNILDLAGNAIVDTTLPVTNLPARRAVDTVAPNATVVALGTGIAGGVTAAEATQPGGVVRVTGDVGATITVTFTRDMNVVTKPPFTGTGASQPVVLTQSEVDLLGDGTVEVSVIQTDAAGNQSLTASTSFILDTIAPTITITSSRSTVQLGQTATITFTLSEPSTSFTVADVAVTGGTLTGFTGSGNSYSATFTPALASTLDGSFTVAAGAFTDSAGNANVDGSLATPITIDRAIRASATGFATSPDGPAYATAVTRIPITFNAPVTGVALAAFSLFFEGRAVSLAGATLTGSGANYVLTLPSTTASLKGRYRLDVGGVGTTIISGGSPMTTVTSIYWQRI